MIFDSYACRVNKGSHRAIQCARKFLGVNSWVLKFDIKKYFFTIDHEILKHDLCKKISDHKIMNLIEQILATYHSPREYHFLFGSEQEVDMNRQIGLPIGNLTSQLFANFFLTSLDRFMKEKLKIKQYVRYMDDALLFAQDKQRLVDAKVAIRSFLETRRLKLHELKSQVFPARHGARFLGFHIYHNRQEILRANLQRFKKRIKTKSWLYRQEGIAWEKVLLSLNAWLGFADKENNRQCINDILSHLKFRHPDCDKKFNFWIPQIINNTLNNGCRTRNFEL